MKKYIICYIFLILMLFLTTGCSFNPLDTIADDYENTANEIADTKFKNAKAEATQDMNIIEKFAACVPGTKQHMQIKTATAAAAIERETFKNNAKATGNIIRKSGPTILLLVIIGIIVLIIIFKLLFGGKKEIVVQQGPPVAVAPSPAGGSSLRDRYEGY